MPTYQYVCTNCGEDIEVVQKFSDSPLSTHEACGGKLRKVFSPVGIVFKGSGFYRTDSRGSSSVTSPNGPEKSEKSASEKSDSGTKSDSAKSESSTKSESKSDSKPSGDSKSSSATKVA